jgi:hypothetical protein
MAIATIGATPSLAASGTSRSAHTIVPTLNIAGDSAGTKKRCRAFNIPISTAATVTIVRNGNMIRVNRIVSSSLPGTAL